MTRSTGPIGPSGIADTITIRNTTTGEPGTNNQNSTFVSLCKIENIDSSITE